MLEFLFPHSFHVSFLFFGLFLPQQLLLSFHFVLDCFADESVGGGSFNVLGIQTPEVGSLEGLSFDGRVIVDGILHNLIGGGIALMEVFFCGWIEILSALG